MAATSNARGQSALKKGSKRKARTVASRMARPRKASAKRPTSRVAERQFVEATVVRGQAVEATQPLPSGATHEIVGRDDRDQPILKRRRFAYRCAGYDLRGVADFLARWFIPRRNAAEPRVSHSAAMSRAIGAVQRPVTSSLRSIAPGRIGGDDVILLLHAPPRADASCASVTRTEGWSDRDGAITCPPTVAPRRRISGRPLAQHLFSTVNARPAPRVTPSRNEVRRVPASRARPIPGRPARSSPARPSRDSCLFRPRA